MAAITAELALEVSKFQSALKTAQQSLRGFKTNTERTGLGLGASLFQGIASVAGGTLVADAFKSALSGAVGLVKDAAEGLKGAFDLGGHLVDVSAQIGSTAGQVLLLQTAFKNAGMEAEDVGAVINKMQKGIATGTQRGSEQESVFKQLGLDPAQLANMDPSAAFQKIGAAIAGIQNPTQRAATAMQVFGRTGARLMSVFGDSGALADAKTMLGDQVQILDQSAADFDKASDIINGAFHKLQGFFVGMGSRVVNALQPFLDELNKIDLAGIGQRFGDAMVQAFQVIKATIQELTAGDMLALVGDGLVAAFKEGINVLWAGLWGAIRAAGQLMIEAFKSAIALVAIVTTADFWKGLGHALISMALAFTATMIHGIAAILDEIKKIPGVGRAVGKANEKTRAYAESLDRKAGVHADAAATNLEKPVDIATKRFTDAGAKIADAFKRGYNDTGSIMDASGEKARIGEAIARINERAKKNQADADQNKKPAPGRTPEIAPFEGQQRGSPGALASAVNLIMGRSANELILDESKKQTTELQQIKQGINRLVDRQPSAAPAPPSVARPIDSTPRFS